MKHLMGKCFLRELYGILLVAFLAVFLRPINVNAEVYETDQKLTSDRTISGDLTIANKKVTIDLNGYKLTVTGNLLQTNGAMKINNGTLTVNGDYRIQREDKGSDSGYTYSDGCLVMTNANDKVIVNGSFYTSSIANYDETGSPNNDLTAGTMKVYGDFIQKYYGYTGKAFPAAGTKVILCGSKTQTVAFDSPTQSYFSDLSLENTDIVVSTAIGGFKLTEDLTFGNGIPVGVYGDMDLNGHKMTVGGDMVIGDKGASYNSDSWGVFNLNGGELTIEGNLRQDASVLKLGGGKMTVKGDYRIQRIDSNKDDVITYRYTDGCIVMDNPEDKVCIEGGFTTSSIANYDEVNTPNNVLLAGEFRVGGDFIQEYHGYTGKAFPSTGTKVVFDGKNGIKQSISFDNPYDSYFYDVSTKNTNIDVLTMIGGWTLSEDVTFNNMPQGTSRNFDLNGYTLEVKGDMVIGDKGKGGSNSDIWGNVTLSHNSEVSPERDSKLIVRGNLRQDAGVFTIDSGTVEIIGDYRVQRIDSVIDNKTTYKYTDGCIVMKKDGAVVKVGGSFITSSIANYDEVNTPNNVLLAGEFHVGGDFIQEYHGYTGKAFPSTGTKVVFDGKNGIKQSISFDNPYDSYFYDVSTKNTNIDVLTMIGGWTLSEDVSFNNMSYGTCRNFDLNGYTLEVNGDMVIGDKEKSGNNSDIWGNVTLSHNSKVNPESDSRLIVRGNLRQDAGVFTVYSGVAEIKGDYRIQRVDAGSDSGYKYTDGCLDMEGDNGTLIVGGDFVTSSIANYDEKNTPNNVLTAGNMYVAGDFREDYYGYSGKAFPAEGTTVILNGKDTQTVSFDYPNNSYFSNLILTNTDVVFASMIRGWKLTQDTIFGNGMENGTCGAFDINGKKLTVNGNMVIGDKDSSYNANWGDFNINGGKVVVLGNLRQDAGELVVGKGTLKVTGDYRIQRVDAGSDYGYKYTDGCLVMKNDKDYVYVGGSFITSSIANYDEKNTPNNVLSAGVMEVRGNFTQKNCGYTGKAYPAEGTHTVVLSGTGDVQYITFDDYAETKSRFQNMKLTRDISYYVFSPDVCWESKTNGSASRNQYVITFDANGGEVSDASLVRDEGEVYGELPVPVRKRYSFNGWYTARKEGSLVSESTIADSDAVVYAHWTEATCAHENTEVRHACEATETEDGYTGDTYCKDCGEKIELGDVIPATGNGENNQGNNQNDNPCAHTNTEIRNKKDATATEDGYTGDTYCKDCGEKIETGEAIPATGNGENNQGNNQNDNPCAHTNTEIRNKKDATATEDGYTGDTYCKNCGEKVGTGETILAKGNENNNNGQNPSGGTPTPLPDSTAPSTSTTTTPPTSSTITTEAPQPSEDATTIGDDDDDEIEVAQVKNVKLTNKRVKRIYISFSPVSGANGYEIRYATKKSMSGAKKMTAKVTKGYFKTAKGKKATFKKGKTYYVQVRAFVKDSDGDKVYGAWSDKKKVKIKK